MLGLIKKDLYMLKSLNSSFYLIIAVIMLFSFVSGKIELITTMAPVMLSTVSINLLAYDRQCEWEQYASALPVTRKQIVTAHYIVSYTAVAAGAFLGLIMGLIARIIGTSYVPAESIVQTAAASLVGILFYLNISTPLIYKLGVEKSRALIIITVMIPIIAVSSFLNYLDSNSFAPQTVLISNSGSAGAIIMTVVLLVVFSAVSIAVSSAIYEKKEF